MTTNLPCFSYSFLKGSKIMAIALVKNQVCHQRQLARSWAM